ncbi:MAG: DUF2029 domain-containing protein [Planctomycetota bacterium]|nr:DUF2029 domain-containing protein [Planctomycetota bacterium]
MKLEDRGDVFVTAALGGLAVLFVVFALWLQWFWAGTSMDIDVYWEAGQRMLHGGRNLYAESEDGTNQVGLFIYPPLFATLFAPITLLPRWAGYALWGLLELLLMAAGLRAARGLCDVPAGRQARLFYLLMIAGLFGALWTNMQEGQVNMLVVSALLAGGWLIERDKPLRGGLLLAAATHLKVIPVVLLPILLAQKRFKAAAGMAAGMLLLWAAPAGVQRAELRAGRRRQLERQPARRLPGQHREAAPRGRQRLGPGGLARAEQLSDGRGAPLVQRRPPAFAAE